MRVWLIALVSVLSNGSAARYSGEQVGLTIALSVPKAPAPNPRPAITGSPCSPQFVLRCSADPVKPYARCRDLESEPASSIKKVSTTFIPQHLGVEQYQIDAQFSTHSFSVVYESSIDRPRFTKPQHLGVSAGVENKSSVFNAVDIIPVFRTSLPALPEISNHNGQYEGQPLGIRWSSSTSPQFKSTQTSRIIQRTAVHRGLGMEVFGRPRHPLVVPLRVAELSILVKRLRIDPRCRRVPVEAWAAAGPNRPIHAIAETLAQLVLARNLHQGVNE
jgi:hypothetical protein